MKNKKGETKYKKKAGGGKRGGNYKIEKETKSKKNRQVNREKKGK